MRSPRLSRSALLRTWAVQQGFGGSAGEQPVEVVGQRSWVRTLGGADPYFALFARGVATGRASIDAAVLAGELRVSPAVRGCMYLVADAHADLALGLARAQSQPRLERDLAKAGASAAKLLATRKAVLKQLEQGPATTPELRKQLPASAIVSFGAAGKKVGLSSSLPPCLRLLEFEGVIERVPLGGCLDTESYRWSLRERPLESWAVADAERAIAELFFRHHGPASLDHFVVWSGLGKRAARAALAQLELLSITVEGHPQGEDEQEMWAFADTLERAQGAARKQSLALLGLQDLYLVVHGGPAWACPEAALEVEIPRWGTMGGGAIGATKHPHLRAVVSKGELVGFWDVDAAMERQHVAWLATPSKALVKRTQTRVRALRAFMREELGHAKTFSIDSDKRINARFELVEGLGDS